MILTTHSPDFLDHFRPEQIRVVAMENFETRIGPDGQLIAETTHGDRFIPQLMELLGRAPAITVDGINVSRPTLEDVFIKLTGHGIRGADAESSLRTMARMWRGRR